MILDEIDRRFFLMVTPRADLGTIGSSDISRSCDICHEGSSYGRQKRLHLYVKDGYENASIACFNCGYKANMYSYLRDNHPSEYELYRKEKQGSSLEELKMIYKKEETTIDNFDFSDLDNTPSLCDIPKGFGSIPDDARDYILNRGIDIQNDWLYGSEHIVFNNKVLNLKDYIIIPMKYDNSGKILGFQALAWKSKRFFIYLLDGNSGWKIWNWNNINKDEPVYIFESIYDALSSGLDNSIAQLGANLSEDRLKELKNPIFCLDNQLVDQKSLEETEKYLNRYKCFIWPKGSEKFKDTNDLRKIKVPYEKIANMIKSNIYDGMSGIIRLKI